MQLEHMSLFVRALLVTVFTAILALASELIFDLVMQWSGHPVVFTSFYAVGLFAGLMGFMPVWPSPSRISSSPIGFRERVLLLFEFTIFVAAAIFASSEFMSYRHIVLSIDIGFAAYTYVLVLVVMFFANFGQLRRENARN